VIVDQLEQERSRREKDMERLNMLSAEQRRAIAWMDMMGDFGSKVGQDLTAE
jgi:hypothetical protein